MLRQAKRLVDGQVNPRKVIAESMATTQRLDAPLVVNGIKGASDVRQGGLADCYFVAAVAAVAEKNPNLIQEAMRENADGTVTFRFFKPSTDAYGRPVMQPHFETVDRLLPAPRDGKLPFGRSSEHEAWFPLMEKAYAQMNGGYQAIGAGGSPSSALEALTGVPARYTAIDKASPSATFQTIKDQLESGKFLVASTPASGRKPGLITTLLDAFMATKRGIVPWHAYSVLGVEEHRGRQFVLLRNPWANTEPGSVGPLFTFSKDSKNDGVFLYPMEEFVRQFEGMHSTE